MKRATIALKVTRLLMLTFFFCLCTIYAQPPGTGWNLVFNEPFNGSSVNTSRWNIRNNSLDWNKNGRQSYFRNQNARVTNGKLYIDNQIHQPSLSNGAEYTGAWMTSKTKFKYGYFEVRCRTASDTWDNHTWPTFWLWDGKGQADSVEFDVFELHRWNTKPEQTLHYENDYRLTNHSNVNAHQWHTYGLLWTANDIIFYIDGVRQTTVSRPNSESYTKAVNFARKAVNQPLILSSSPNREMQPPLNVTLPSFIVEHVKVWQGGNPNGSGNTGNPIVSMKKGNINYNIDGNFNGANGQNVYLWASNNNNINQQWEEINRGGGFYSYKKRNTNYCLDGGNGGANGQNVYLWECGNNNQNQHWRKVNLGNNKFRLEKRNASGFSIDGGNGGANGQNLYLWASNNNNVNQQWQFSNLGTARSASGKRVVENKSIKIDQNPAIEHLTVSGLQIGDRIEVYTIDGKLSLQNSVSKTTAKIPVSHLQSGLYLLKVYNSEHGVSSLKFLKN